ncbi:Phosphoenolpyruvate carboxykinase [Apostichopus japonicus]|uniref:Phosphoenolpyruvate carboxykinase n=1 Tax=Stichopus japonicus TaxID=307972 RepID=A0A2G8LFJ0_STIJA|nr:Phosphoenolpyruvate carboxykinase [Apostichopus japonicus]
MGKHSHRAFKSLKQTAFRIHTHGQLYSHAAATLKIPNVDTLQPNVRKYVQEKMSLCQPDNIHICDGSEAENDMLLSLLEKEGMIKKLKKHENCWLAVTDPRDVARVEKKTIISTQFKRDTIPTMKEGVECLTGQWMSPDQLQGAFQERFPGCMKVGFQSNCLGEDYIFRHKVGMV